MVEETDLILDSNSNKKKSKRLLLTYSQNL